MKLRVIPTTVHGAVDHVVGPALIAAPEIFRLDKTSPEGVVPRVNGIAAAVYSNLTDYELSLKNVIPMRVHLALDALAGATLAAVPLATGARKRGADDEAGGAAVAAAAARANAAPRVVSYAPDAGQVGRPSGFTKSSSSFQRCTRMSASSP